MSTGASRVRRRRRVPTHAPVLIPLLAIAGCRAVDPTAAGGTDANEAWWTLESLEQSAQNQGGAQPSGASGEAASQSASDFATVEDSTMVSPPVDEGAKIGGIPISGQLTTRYRGRFTDSDSDHDLFGYLSLDIGDPRKDRVTGHLDARASLALDGLHQSGPFQDIQDSYSSDLDGRLYTAYADIHQTEGLDVVRIGRQQYWMAPELAFFDGVQLETEELSKEGLKLGTYGGKPVHLYAESSQGDWLFGLYGEGQPWKGGRLRLDWMRAEDQVSIGTLGDDLWNLGIWQRIEAWRLEGGYSRLGGRNRDLRLRGTWTDLEADAQVRASFYRLLTTQFALPLEFDWFSTSLFQLQPYTQVQLTGSKRWSNRYRLEGGADLRRVTETVDVGTYNRDVDRFYVTGTVEKIFSDSTALSLTADTWDGNGREYDTFSGDVTQVFSKDTRGSLGTFFALYSVDLQTGEEREDVRTWFVRLDHRFDDAWRLEGRYDFENTSIADFHVLRLRLVWSF